MSRAPARAEVKLLPDGPADPKFWTVMFKFVAASVWFMLSGSPGWPWGRSRLDSIRNARHPPERHRR